MKRTVAALVLLSSLGLTACIGIDGSSKKVAPTVGQELIDLKAALDRGIITQAEYDRQKALLLAPPA